MTITTTVEDKLGTIVPKGSIDSTTADILEQAFNELDSENLETLVFDFKDVDFISSKCLRILVAIRKRMPGKSIIIANANTTVADIINLSGLAPLFELK